MSTFLLYFLQNFYVAFIAVRYPRIYAVLTHAGLTTRYRTKSLYKSIFVLSRSPDI